MYIDFGILYDEILCSFIKWFCRWIFNDMDGCILYSVKWKKVDYKI